jgi:hypothetical protein
LETSPSGEGRIVWIGTTRSPGACALPKIAGADRVLYAGMKNRPRQYPTGRKLLQMMLQKLPLWVDDSLQLIGVMDQPRSLGLFINFISLEDSDETPHLGKL